MWASNFLTSDLSLKLILGFLVLTTFTGYAQTEKWVIDNAHTKIGFEVPHLIISSVDGKFKTFAGEVLFDVKETKKSVKDFSFSVSCLLYTSPSPRD